MTKPASARALLTSTARLATLVCVGVAETACNLQFSPEPPDVGPRIDAGRDGGSADASRLDATTSDATTRDGATSDAATSDAATSDAGETPDAAGEPRDAPAGDDAGPP